MLILLAVILLLYGAAASLMFARQADLLFPASKVGLSPPLPEGSQALHLVTPDAQALHGMLIPAAMTDARAPLILGFGGNAWNGAAAALYLHTIYPHSPVIVFHYRGYTPSEGQPSARALLADAPLIYDHARSLFPARRIVGVAFSIGTGVVAHLATERPLDGLILVTPFASLTSVARSHVPWLPVSLLLRHRMEPAEDLSHVSVPVAVVAAERDRLIPPSEVARLRQKLPHLIFDKVIAGRGHNDIYQDAGFKRELAKALIAIS